MSASRRQELIAQNWPAKILLFTTTLVSALAIGGYSLLSAGRPDGVTDRLALAGYIAAAAALGYLVGGLMAVFILGPLYYQQSLDNGAPYEPGDRVRLLVGRRRGQIVRVYGVWAERNQVRVELGDAERDAVTDVFSYYQVCREPAAATSASGPESCS